MAVKMIGLDLDQTFLDFNKKIPEENVDAVREALAEGMEVLPVTGRPFGAIPEEILDFCGVDMGLIPMTDVDVSFKGAGWCGFFYRMLHFELQMPSRDIASLIPFDDLVLSYPGLHTVDEYMAVDIIKKKINRLLAK